MGRKQSKPILIIEFDLNVCGRIYQISLAQTLRWLVLIVLIVVRLVKRLLGETS